MGLKVDKNDRCFSSISLSVQSLIFRKNLALKKIFAKNIESQNFNCYVSACFSYCSLRKQHNETFHYPLLAAEKILELHWNIKLSDDCNFYQILLKTTKNVSIRNTKTFCDQYSPRKVYYSSKVNSSSGLFFFFQISTKLHCEKSIKNFFSIRFLF